MTIIIPRREPRKTCPCCEERLPHSAFAKNRSAKDGLQYYCRVCVNSGAYKDPDRKNRARVNRGTRSNGLVQKCTDCGELKPASAFAGRESGRNKSHCRDCWNEWRAGNRAGNPERYAAEMHRGRLFRHRGMTEELFDEMFVEQSGRCGICSDPMVTQRSSTATKMQVAHLDHDHTCCPKYGCLDCIRALLCARCNFLLGFARDDINILFSAIAYLIEHGAAKPEELDAQDSPGVSFGIPE